MERFDLNQEQVADKVGKSRPSVANMLRLLKLNPYVQEKLRENEITFGHARALLSIKESKLQKQLTDMIVEKQLSVRDVEKYIQMLDKKAEQDKNKGEKEINTLFYREIQENLQKLFGTKVSISKGNKKGKIEIEYYSDDELERIIQIINRNK